MPLTRKRVSLVVLAVLCALTVCSNSSFAFRQRGATLLVFPSRYVIVQLAFDLADMRKVILLAYQGGAGAEQPTLHVWHAGKWVEVSAQSYADRKFLRGDPARTIVVGPGKQLPPLLLTASAWCGKVARVEQTDIAGLVNGIARELRLRRREVQWLAERYGLTLKEARTGVAGPSAADMPTETTLSSRWDMPQPLEEPTAPIP